MLLKNLYEIASKLEYHNELNPKIWDEDSLNDDVRAALNKITNKFIEFLKIEPVHVTDVILTGSNCNYNWTKFSDIDLHIVLDYESMCGDGDCGIDVNDCMLAKKSLWNDSHDITIYCHDVELYAQNGMQADVSNSGIYSLSKNQWIKYPTKENVKYDEDLISQKAEKIIHEIDTIIDSQSDNTAEIDRLKEKIKMYRKAGLEKHGEFSLENLVFKALRNNNYLEKLYDYAADKENETLSLE